MVSCPGRVDVPKNEGHPQDSSVISNIFKRGRKADSVVTLQSLLCGCSAGGLPSILHCDTGMFLESYEPVGNRYECLEVSLAYTRKKK